MVATSAAGAVASAAGAARERRHQCEFGFGCDRHVQEERRQTDKPMPIGAPDRIRRELKHTRPIAEVAVRQRAFICLEDRHEIRRNALDGVRAHSCRAQFRNDAGDGARKSGLTVWYCLKPGHRPSDGGRAW